MKNILIVCTANKSRSPMAMEIARRITREKGLERKYNFDSAGITAIGIDIDSEAADALDEIGIKSSHTPVSLEDVNIAGYDEIHVMTDRQKITLVSLFNAPEEKIRVLGVEDPYGKGAKEYKECREIFLKFYGDYLDNDANGK